MSNKEIRDIQRNSDILHAIKLVNSFVKDVDFNSFYKSELMQSAVIHQFQIIGEAPDKISEIIKTAFSNIPWSPSTRLENYSYMNILK